MAAAYPRGVWSQVGKVWGLGRHLHDICVAVPCHLYAGVERGAAMQAAWAGPPAASLWSLQSSTFIITPLSLLLCCDSAGVERGAAMQAA
jgi:hypothetical protein